MQSMTGYGKGERTLNGLNAVVELRSVNSRFFELTARLPRSLSLRENEIKEIIRAKISRGKITVAATIEGETDGRLSLHVNQAGAKAYYRLLNQLRRSLKLRETVKLDHMLRFSEIFEGEVGESENPFEWKVFTGALECAVDRLREMRENEGREISKDLIGRIETIDGRLSQVEEISRRRIPDERTRLNERISELLNDRRVIDAQRLELEIAILADKLDVTEECVRFRSHNKFFLAALKEEGAGRKLNFLIQEMNREANTIGSKSNDTAIAYHVVAIKEELERIREQLQNIE